MHGCSHSVGRVFATRVIGIICLLIAIVLANILKYYITNPVYVSGIAFINGNFWLILLIAVIFLVGAVFGAFPFPFNMPAPLIRAFGSVFCIMLLLLTFEWVDSIAATKLSHLFSFLSPLIAILVFLIVLVSGYADIMRRLWLQAQVEDQESGKPLVIHAAAQEEDDLNGNIPISDAKSWEEIGAEFRLMLYDIIHRFRQEIKRKK